MNHNLPPNNEIEPKLVDDNARKLILLQIDPAKLMELGATTYDVDIQWSDVSDDTETKVVYKVNVYDEIDAQILRIVKSTIDGMRSTTRESIPYEEFLDVKEHSKDQPRLTKRRSEFTYVQGEVEYSLKYDEFKAGRRNDGKQRLFCTLEVDAETDEQREQFDPEAFELAQIYAEATGNPDYTGYRIIPTLQKIQG